MPETKKPVDQKMSLWIKNKANRKTSANLLMVSFILLTSIGAGIISVPVGLIVAGVSCGLFGFLLGSE